MTPGSDAAKSSHAPGGNPLTNDDIILPMRTLVFLLFWAGLGAACLVLDRQNPGTLVFGAGRTAYRLLGSMAVILAAVQTVKLGTHWILVSRHRPATEARMIGRLYDLLGAAVLALALADSFGKLNAFGAVFAAFGGMLLGWSLQAPVSGFAAWILVSMKRPFRPGDRIQLPTLGLTGDVKEVGVMYTVLDQVGGTIGSEEAVGRYILVPNAMLFSQVVINYTVKQESPYMLDEVVIRITYDSDWEESERILTSVAARVTRDIIDATGVKPYIRSDWYDYGVYLRLRFMTRVKDRAEIAYLITKQIFIDVQATPRVDMAIPYIYSNRAALERREEEGPRNRRFEVSEIDLTRVLPGAEAPTEEDVQKLVTSISAQGLLQPVIVKESERTGYYETVAGQARIEACRRLGWRTIPAVVQKPVSAPAPAAAKPGG